MAADPAARAAALALLRAIAGDASGAGADRSLASRILRDRLHPWAEPLRCFDLDCACLPQRAAASEGPWLAHLEVYHATLGTALFCSLCDAHTQALQGFWRQKGARILDRGLKANDDLQAHALATIRRVWGEVVDRSHSQEYCDRAATKIVHSGTQTEYTPPSCGPIQSSYWTEKLGVPAERATADVERVVRVALVNPKARFDDGHLPLYHGIAATGFDAWAKSGPAFVAYPGRFGEGVYLTPSFQMACMYAFRTPQTVAAAAKDRGGPRFASTPDGRWNYMLVFQAMARASALESFSGTAFTDAGDGWDLEAQIRIVRDPAAAQIYGALFCYFPRMFSG